MVTGLALGAVWPGLLVSNKSCQGQSAIRLRIQDLAALHASPPTEHMALYRGQAPIPTGPTERWSMDFMHDTLADGRPFQILTVVDNWSRCSSVLEAIFRMT